MLTYADAFSRMLTYADAVVLGPTLLRAVGVGVPTPEEVLNLLDLLVQKYKY